MTMVEGGFQNQKIADCAAMVAQRNMTEEFLDNVSGPSIAKALEQLTHVKLDKEKISSIDEICYVLSLPNMTNLYVQQNRLSSLSGIEAAKGLKVLIVSNNLLYELSDLTSLSKLMVLDVSDNALSRIDAAKLPQSLSFLDVDGNPCCIMQCGLRQHLKDELPNLKELDGDSLTDDFRSDYSVESNGTSEEEGACSEDNDADDHENKNEEDDHRHVEEFEHQEDMQQVFRTPGDIGKEVTSSEEGCNESSRAVTPSGQGCNKSSRRITPTLCKQGLTQPPIPEIVERLGTPSSVVRALGSTPLPHLDKVLEDARESELQEYYQLKDCLYESNLESEAALQTVLSHTIGGLGHHCNMMVERIHERMKNLDVQLGEEIAQMFFNPESSPISTTMDQSPEPSSASNISNILMSPISLDHWKYVASTPSDSSNSKGSPSVRNTHDADSSYQESLTSE